MKNPADAVALQIGLLCSEVFDFDGLMVGKIQEELGIPLTEVSKFNVKGEVLVYKRDGEVVKIPLKEAQELGYAEAKADADVEGWDAVAKVVILSKSVMGVDIGIKDVDRTGITGISLEDVEAAKKEGKRWKLIGKVAKEGAGVRASVKPEKVALTDPLASVGGATNALTFATDLLGDVTIVGPGAGRKETGYSLLVDLLTIHRMSKR